MTAGDMRVLDPPSESTRPGVLAAMRAHLVMLTVGALIGGTLGYFASSLLPTAYTASSSVFFSVSGPFHPWGEGTEDVERFVAEQAEIMTTTDVLENAAGRLTSGLSAEDVRGDVTALSSADTSRVTVVVERSDPQEAKDLADAVVAAYRDRSAARVGEIARAAQDTIIDDYLEGQIRVRAEAYRDGVAAVELAVLPTSPSAPLPAQNALVGAASGFLVALGLAVLAQRRRFRIASPADLDLLIGAPLITRLDAPASPSAMDVVVTAPPAEQLHAVHDVLAAIDVALEGQRCPSVLFLSWQRALTTTSLVISAGLAAARGGRKVVLIDGGLKDRGISSFTDVDPGLGLDALTDTDRPVSAAMRLWRVGGVGLDVVPLADWSPSQTGAAARPQVLRSAAARLADHTSLILVDGPPLTERSLGLALGRGVDGVVLVIDEQSSIDDAHEMGRRVALAGTPVLGYVLVGPPRRGRLRGVSWPLKRHAEGSVSLEANRRASRP